MTTRWDVTCTKRECPHPSSRDGHCQEPSCPAYVQDCPEHLRHA